MRIYKTTTIYDPSCGEYGADEIPVIAVMDDERELALIVDFDIKNKVLDDEAIQGYFAEAEAAFMEHGIEPICQGCNQMWLDLHREEQYREAEAEAEKLDDDQVTSEALTAIAHKHEIVDEEVIEYFIYGVQGSRAHRDSQNFEFKDSDARP